MSHAPHDHAAHGHGHSHADHDHGGHGLGSPRAPLARPEARDAAVSLLRASALERLAIAAGAVAAVWAGVVWAMS